MKLRKLIAILSAVMMLCAIIPVSVSAAASDVTTNFDNGSKNGWSGPTVSADAAYAGAYGATASSTSAWGSLLKKTATLEKHTAYKLTFWYKSNANAVTNAAFEMKDPNSAKVPLMNKASTSVSLAATTTTWTQVELYFTTGDYTDVQFLFYRGSGTAGDAASISVDEIVLTEVEADTDGYIVDGGFESGTMNFTPNSKGSITTDAHSGNYAVTGTSSTKYDIYAQKYVRVEKNTDYTFTFYAKASGSGKVARLYINAKKFSSTSSNDLRGTYSNQTINTTWEKQEVTFNSGANTEIALSLCSSGSTATYYFDDLALIGPNNITPDEPDTPDKPENPYEPVEGNLLQNPSIETGTDSGWTYSGTVATNELAHSGSYSLKSTNNSGAEWKTMAKQAVSVTANTDYTLSYWYYYAGEQTDVSFYAMANDANGAIQTVHVKNITPYTWNQVTVNFNSGSNTSITVYAKNGTANSTGAYYFDDFVLVAVGGTEPDTPSGDTEDPVPGNLIKEGTFENGSKSGWTTYYGSAPSTDAAYKGSYGLHCKGNNWGGIAETTVKTEVGKTYQLNFWYKINVAGFNWKVTGVVTGTKYAGYWQNTNLGTWQNIVVEFIADDTQVMLTLLGLNENSSPDFYVDSVSIIEVQGPSNDGFIVNGDFEVGKLTGWSFHQSTEVSTAAANGSNYGVNLKGNGGWGGMLNQSFKTTKGLKYVLTLDLKVNNYGVNMQVRNVADDANLASRWFDSNCNTWTTYTFEFTAVSADTYINFCGGGNGASLGGEDVYVDNIKIVEIPCEHEWDSIQDADCNICGHIREVDIVDIVNGGMTSASEEVNGLAFRFEIASTGATVDGNNKYVSNSATVRPFGNDNTYTLITMGAVFTNKAANGNEAGLNLNTVNGKNVIKIEAQYLLETNDDSLAFATRIINIPEAGKNTTIYARPYYVFEKNGEMVVVYDDIVAKSYTEAIA